MKNPPSQPHRCVERYETVLLERQTRGRSLMQAASHPEAAGDVPALLRATQALERRLERFRRWAYDEAAVVQPIESAAMHDPVRDPRDDCPWCARAQLHLTDSARLPLPAEQAPRPISNRSRVGHAA